MQLAIIRKKSLNWLLGGSAKKRLMVKSLTCNEMSFQSVDEGRCEPGRWGASTSRTNGTAKFTSSDCSCKNTLLYWSQAIGKYHHKVVMQTKVKFFWQRSRSQLPFWCSISACVSMKNSQLKVSYCKTHPIGCSSYTHFQALQQRESPPLEPVSCMYQTNKP